MADDNQDEIARLEARLAELKAKPDTTVTPPAAAPASVPAKGNKAVGCLVGGLAIMAILIGLATCQPSTKPATPVTPDDPHNAALPAAGTAPAQAATPWVYSSETDPMTDRKTNMACVDSTNEVQQIPPYNRTGTRLCIRQSPKFGLDAYVQLLDDGQVMCQSYMDCTVKVRFGDHAQQSFSGSGASDGSTRTIFLRNSQRFITGTKGADVTRVEIEIYQAGRQILEFPTKGLVWPRPAT